MDGKGRKKSVFSKISPKLVNKDLELKKWLN